METEKHKMEIHQLLAKLLILLVALQCHGTYSSEMQGNQN